MFKYYLELEKIVHKQLTEIQKNIDTPTLTNEITRLEEQIQEYTNEIKTIKKQIKNIESDKEDKREWGYVEYDEDEDEEEENLKDDLNDYSQKIVENQLQISKIKEWIEEHKLFATDDGLCKNCHKRPVSKCPFQNVLITDCIGMMNSVCEGFCDHVTKNQQYKNNTKEELILIHQTCYMCAVNKDEEEYIKDIILGENSSYHVIKKMYNGKERLYVEPKIKF